MVLKENEFMFFCGLFLFFYFFDYSLLLFRNGKEKVHIWKIFFVLNQKLNHVLYFVKIY